jgi:hypothetical protein
MFYLDYVESCFDKFFEKYLSHFETHNLLQLKHGFMGTFIPQKMVVNGRCGLNSSKNTPHLL